MTKNLRSMTVLAVILSIAGATSADITVTQRITMDGIPEMAGGGPAPAPAPKPAPKPAPVKKATTGKKGGKISTSKPAPAPGAAAASTPANADGVRETVMQVKGNIIRTVAGDIVSLTDVTTDDVTMFNTKEKTFAVLKGGKIAGMPDMTEMMDSKVLGEVTPDGASTEVDGRAAQGYKGLIKVEISPKAGVPLPFDPSNGPLLTMSMKFSATVTKAVKLDESILAKLGAKAVSGGMAGMMPGAAEIAKKFQSIIGFPLTSNMEMTIESAMALPGLPEKPIKIKTETIKLDETDLDANLFKVPAGFKQVDPESMMGGMGMIRIGG
ncbi:MAG: hypothetical protein ACOYLC_12515 [Armatimonadaceae bacterium]